MPDRTVYVFNGTDPVPTAGLFRRSDRVTVVLRHTDGTAFSWVPIPMSEAHAERWLDDMKSAGRRLVEAPPGAR